MDRAPGSNVPRPWRRRLFRLFVLAGGFYLVVALMFAGFQRSLVYPALKSPPLLAQDWRPAGTTMENVTAATADGLTLHGWHLRPERGDPTAGRPLVLIFHGNGGHRAQSLDEAELFASLGAESLIFDYRGYAENAGAPSEAGLAADARAAWDYATGTLGVPPGRIVLYGQSLGGGVAVRLAADLGAAGTPPAGLVVVNTFTSLVDAAAHHYPWLPVRLALLDRYESERRIAEVACPVLVMHGDADVVIPHRSGRRLFEAAPPRSATGVAKRFVTLSGANHNDALIVARGPFRGAVAAFLSETVTGPRP